MEESCLFGPVISISPIEIHNSVPIALVAVMESGTRIYFTVNGASRPTSFQIAHVRMPPGYTGSSPAQRPSKIRTAIYNRGYFTINSKIKFSRFIFVRFSNDLVFFSFFPAPQLTILGTCLLINSHEGCQDKLWCLSGDLTPFSPVLSETLAIAGLDGVVWSLEKYGPDMFITSVLPEPPLLVTQHYEFSTKYVCLTDRVCISFL